MERKIVTPTPLIITLVGLQAMFFSLTHPGAERWVFSRVKKVVKMDSPFNPVIRKGAIKMNQEEVAERVKEGYSVEVEGKVDRRTITLDLPKGAVLKIEGSFAHTHMQELTAEEPMKVTILLPGKAGFSIT